MSNTEITYLIAGVAALASLGAWIWLIVVPAWSSYWRPLERIVSVLASLYVLVALLAAGAGIGALVLYYYNEI
jgi:hypothetical protein